MIINSVDKAITVLNCFSKKKPVLSVGDISKMTGYTLSGVSRLLGTLEARGVVEKAAGHGCYSLGYQIYFWGLLNQTRNSLSKLSLPFMETLRNKCNEEVSLYIIIDNHRSCLQRIESKHAIAMTGSIGLPLPLHAGASGQTLLANMPEETWQQIIENEKLEKFTDNTLADTTQLLERLEKIREQGYGVSLEERELGAYSIAAPIWDATGRVVASLCIAGPIYRLTDKLKQSNIVDVKYTAGLISETIGFTPR